MKRRGANRPSHNRMQGTLEKHFKVQFHTHQSSSATSSSLFPRNLLDFGSQDDPSTSAPDLDAADDKDFILSQDFFCTPDYITPDNQNLMNGFGCNKENIPFPKSPEKLNTLKSKRIRQDGILANLLSPTLYSSQQIVELANDNFDADEGNLEKTIKPGVKKAKNYVSQSAVALRCRVCHLLVLKTHILPMLQKLTLILLEIKDQSVKVSSLQFSVEMAFRAITQIFMRLRLLYPLSFCLAFQQIGTGNFSRVFKVLKRIDGCLYAVKHSTGKLHQDTERRKALMEVQALAAVAFQKNISSTVHRSRFPESLASGLQMAKALQFIHEKGIVHLDVKPDNIYVKNGVYKLGDFGCATLLNRNLPIEEGDARYMPQEILNENYDHLDKVMVDHDPARRPSAKEIVENPIFDKASKMAKA
ncbi:Kinase WEE1 isoform 2 [Hibiscus syriacus]|uniref:Kinase WEE1 isoform 2 n=1 Tax=Hibiscus syriacus TaxID=106335 RepID=A0A6A2ZQA8_HIBSY|nr:Kinase WEE1 isoform 2 [Hibiscus syriacus]